jgi:hypothetical protein
MGRKWNWKKKYGNFSVQQLLTLLNDDSNDEKFIPIYILGELEAKEAVDDLIKILDFSENEILWEELDNLAAVYSLGKIKDERAVKPLIKLLKNKPFDVTSAAAWALGEIGDKRAIPALEKALKDDEYDTWWSEGIETAEHLVDQMIFQDEKAFVSIFNHIQSTTFGDESSIEKSLRKLKKKK